LTLAALQAGVPSESWAELSAGQLHELGVHARPADLGFRVFARDRDLTGDIRTPLVNAHVSHMARVPAVRTWLLERLREAARATDLVADGRDMGTVVFPDADLKIFLTADPNVRARRRLAEQGVPEPAAGQIDDETQRLTERDRMDREREVGPLRAAPDAIVVDTSRLSFQDQVDAIERLARDRLAGVDRSSPLA
jgi:cytidylate kinase